MNTEHWWENTAREIMKLSEKNLYQCHFLHHKSHIYDFSVERRRQMATNKESERTCKDSVIVIVRNYPRICVMGMYSTKKEKKKERKSRRRESMSRPRIDAGTSRTQVSNVTAEANMLASSNNPVQANITFKNTKAKRQ